MVYEDIVARLRAFLRKNIADPKGRGSDTTDTFSGNDSLVDFQLIQEQVAHIKSCNIGGVDQTEFVDFVAKYNYPTAKKATIRFTTAPPTGTDNIAIEYHYGGTWIQTGYPNDDFTSPRISLTHISSREEEQGLGNALEAGEEGIGNVAWYQVDVWVRSGDKATVDGEICAGGRLVDVLADKIEKAFFSNKAALKEQGIEDIILRMSRDISMTMEKVMRKLMDYEVLFILKK